MAPRARQAKSKARSHGLRDAPRGGPRQASGRHAKSTFPPGRSLGNVVVEAKNLRKAYDDKLLMDDLSFALPRGGIVGVIGPNGAGKTTLFRMIVGQEDPDSGSLRLGETVELAYVDQIPRCARSSEDGLAGNLRRRGPDHRWQA